MSVLRDNFNPELRCRAVHPFYGDQCQMHGGLSHKGRHQAMLELTPGQTTFSYWEDSPLDKPPPIPWSMQARSERMIVSGTVVLVCGTVMAVLWLASVIADFMGWM